MFDDLFDATLVEVDHPLDGKLRCPECGLENCWICGSGVTTHAEKPGHVESQSVLAQQKEDSREVEEPVAAHSEATSLEGANARELAAQELDRSDLDEYHAVPPQVDEAPDLEASAQEAMVLKSAIEAPMEESKAVQSAASPAAEESMPKLAAQSPAVERGAPPEQARPAETEAHAKATVTVFFEYKAQRWNHEFDVPKGSTVLELKQAMVKHESPPEDAFSFDLFLKSNKKRRSNMDVVTSGSEFTFEYIGPEDGRRRLERDRYVRAEEEKAELAKRLREEEHARIMAEKAREARELQERRRKEAEEEERRQLAEMERRRKEQEEKQALYQQNAVESDNHPHDPHQKEDDGNVWEVIGGKDVGLIVRVGKDLSSEKQPERIRRGSLLLELELDSDSDRLHYKLLTGHGPASGWVTIRLRTPLDNIGMEKRWSVRNLVVRRDAALATEDVENMETDRLQPEDKQQVAGSGDDVVERGVDRALRGVCQQCKNCAGWQRYPRAQFCHARQPSKRQSTSEEGIETLRGMLLPSLCEDVPKFDGTNFRQDGAHKENRHHASPGNSKWPCGHCGCPEYMHQDLTKVFGKYAEREASIPLEALTWSQVELALWFDTQGRFHPGKMRRPKRRSANNGNSEPLVSVIVPTTASRRPFHPFIWQCFYAQKYQTLEMVVIDTCEAEPSEFFLSKAKVDKRVQYHHFNVPEGLWNVGIKRNLACYFATGEVIVHFDDDDMYAGCYIKEMVQSLQKPAPELLETGVKKNGQDVEPPIDEAYTKAVLGKYKAVCAKLSSWYTFAIKSTQWGHYDTMDSGRGHANLSQLYGWGFSMVYLRRAWVACPFIHTRIGEDYDVVKNWRMLGMPVVFMPDNRGICAHTNHADNTASGADRGGTGYGNKLLYGPLSNQVALYERAASMLKNAQGPSLHQRQAQEERGRTPSPQGRAPTPPGFRDRKPGARGGRSMASALLRDAITFVAEDGNGAEKSTRPSGFADASDDSD